MRHELKLHCLIRVNPPMVIYRLLDFCGWHRVCTVYSKPLLNRHHRSKTMPDSMHPPALTYTRIDAVARLGYRVIYRLWKLYLRIAGRETFGAQVAVIHRDRILLTKSSYRDFYTLPGGYLKQGETTAECARRELSEEVGLADMKGLFRPAFKAISRCGGHIGHDEIFEYRLEVERDIFIDNREIVFAGFIDMSRALHLPIDNLVRQYITHYHTNLMTEKHSSVAS